MKLKYPVIPPLCRERCICAFLKSYVGHLPHCHKKKPTVSYFPGYTDTAVIAGKLQNHNCMSYGPGNLECAHQPDEWVAVEDILRCENVYFQMTDLLF